MARMNGIQDVAKTSPDPSRVLWVILATNKPVFKILFFSLFFVQKERESHRKGRTGYSAAGAQRATRPSLSLSIPLFHLNMLALKPTVTCCWTHSEKENDPFPVSIDPTSFTLPFLRPSSMLVFFFCQDPPSSRRKGAIGVLIGQAFFFLYKLVLPPPLSLFFSTVVNRHSPSPFIEPSEKVNSND